MSAAKNSRVLRQLHSAMKDGEITKKYSALLAGCLNKKKLTVYKPLHKNTIRSGERVVTVDKSGKSAVTIFIRERVYDSASLVNIELITGRTHQIRVHSSSIGHSVVGDTKYGDHAINREFRKMGLKRMFLHAKSLKFRSPTSSKIITVKSDLDQDLINFLEKLSIKSA